MKVSFKKALYAMAVALGLQSCSQAFIETPATPGEGRIIRVFSMSDDTKSVFGDKDGSAYTTLWTSSRQAGFSANGSALADATPQLIAGGKDASFDVTLSASQTSGTLYGCSPVRSAATGGFDSITSVTIPAQQVPLAGSCDESAQLLLGSCALDASSELAMKFHHISAYGRMTIKGLDGSIASVYLTFPQPVAGEGCSVNLSTGIISGMTERTIWLDAANAQNSTFWFGIAPTGTLSTGKLSVRVILSDGRSYTRSIDLSSKNIAFQKGRVTSFGVDMASVIPEYIFRRTDVVTSGQKYLFVSGDAAMTVPSGKNYGYPGYTAVEPSNGIIVMPDLKSALTLTASGTGYTIMTSFGAYLYQTAEYNSFNWDATASSGRVWRISIASNGDATITNVEKSKYIQLRTGYASFGSYATKQSDGVLPKLYVLDCGAEYYEGDLSDASTPGTTPEPGTDPVDGPAMGLGWMELPAVSGTQYGYFKHMMNFNGSSFRNYSYCYDYTNYVSHWVAYPLNSSLRGSGSRTNSWSFDPNMADSAQQNTPAGSYRTSGFDRGHQIPSADRVLNQAANVQTFYGTNMTPQLANFNQGIWATVESTVRNWSDNSDTLYVVTGCTLAANSLSGTEGEIGGYALDRSSRKIAIPTAYYKVVLRYSRNSSVGWNGYAGCALYFEHAATSGSTVIKSKCMSIDALEEITGLDFFVNLPRAIGEENAAKVEAQDPKYVSLWW